MEAQALALALLWIALLLMGEENSGSKLGLFDDLKIRRKGKREKLNE